MRPGRIEGMTRLLAVLLFLCAPIAACGGQPADRTVNGGWERLDARGPGIPLAVGDEIVAVSGGGDQRMRTFAYVPATESMRQVARSPLPWRCCFTAIAAGRKVLIWGGSPSGHRGEWGASYEPNRDAWQRIPPSPAPVPTSHSAAWSGEEMLVWGGETKGVCSGPINPEPLGYDPDTREWRKLERSPMPGRVGHVAVWCGEQMLVWGGTTGRDGACEPTDHKRDGAAFDPDRNEWVRIPEAPIGWLEGSDAVWTGEELLVWNGKAVALYDPSTETWRQGAPAPLQGVEVDAREPQRARIDEAVARTGGELFVWGGGSPRQPAHRPYVGGSSAIPRPPIVYTDGALYDPETDSWSILPAAPRGISWRLEAVWHDGSVYVVARQGWIRYRPDLSSSTR